MHDQQMWNRRKGEPSKSRAARVRHAWPTTVAALPVGATVTGVVADQRRFGVFIELDGHPDVMAFVDIGPEPRGSWLPEPGTRVTATVCEHVPDNCRVKLRMLSPIEPSRADMRADEAETNTRFTVTLVVDAPHDLPGYEAQFEPEGAILAMAPGDRVTVTMTGPTPPEILVHPYPGGLSIWRCMNLYEVTVTDSNGEAIEGLY